MTTRKLPNVLITGTPGTGKTTTAEKVAEALEGLQTQRVHRARPQRATGPRGGVARKPYGLDTAHREWQGS
jgi:adenylate kinase family enzyme